MPVPRLRTEGIDISRGLLGAEQIRASRAQRETEGLQQQLLRKQLEPEPTREEQLEYETDLLTYARDSAAGLTGADEYPAYYQNLQRFGFNMQLVPRPANIQTPEDFEAWRGAAVRDADAYLKEQAELRKPEPEVAPPTFGQPKPGVDEEGKPLFFTTDKAGNVKVISGVKPQPAKGMRIYDREGNLLVDTSGRELAKPTVTKLEKTIVESKETVARTEAMLEKFEPEFLTIGGKLKSEFYNLKDKIKGDLPPDEAEYIGRFAEFTQESTAGINQYIQQMTGAAVSAQEAVRLRKAMPDPGDSVLSGDGPKKFISKAKNVIRSLKLAEARAKILREKGFDVNPENIAQREQEYPYKRVVKMLETRADEIGLELEADNPGMPLGEIDRMVTERLKALYGF